MHRFAGVSGVRQVAGRPVRTGPSLLEQLAAAEASDEEAPRDIAAPLPASRPAPPYAGFDQPDALLIGDNAEDPDDDEDEEEGQNERHDGALGSVDDGATMLERQGHAEELFRGIEFLRASGVDESSSVFQSQVDEFMEAAGDLFGRTAGRLPSDAAVAGRSRGDTSDNEEDGDGDDRMGGGPGGAASAALALRAPAPPSTGGADEEDDDDEEGAGEDDPLYDPAADDEDARWVLENLQRLGNGGGEAAAGCVQQPRAGDSSAEGGCGDTGAAQSSATAPDAGETAGGAVLSCPGCFTIVCYNGRPHPRRADVFVSTAAISVFVDRTQPHVRAPAAAAASSASGRAPGLGAPGLTTQPEGPGRSQRLASWSAAGAAVSPAPSAAVQAGKGAVQAPFEVTTAAAAVVWPPPLAEAPGARAAASAGPLCYAVSCAHCGFGLGVLDDATARLTFEYAIAGDG